jgi:hypothetical protein
VSRRATRQERRDVGGGSAVGGRRPSAGSAHASTESGSGTSCNAMPNATQPIARRSAFGAAWPATVGR